MKNPFKIPNKPSALPMKPFCKKGDYTWEDWQKEAKEKYPIRYLLSEEIPFFLTSRIKNPLVEFHYWLKSHLLPSRRYHMLDLRQPEDYKYGWIDSDNQILYACFNILVNFIEKEHKGRYQEYVQFQEQGVKHELPELREIWTIYEWWTIHRSKKLKAVDNALHDWCVVLDTTSNDEDVRNSPLLETLKKKHLELEESFNKEQTEMLKRLIELRHNLWS